MGTVFKAWDTKLERWVAIKTVRAGAGMAEFWDGDVVRGLVSEAAMVARFNHPHVVSVYDVQDATDAAYIVMEFVDGVSLEDLVHRGRLSPALTVPLLRALASALAAAHAVHVLHRDVKPGNVLLGRDGAIRLTDFGIASFRVRADASDAVRTPGYMPPETLRGKGFDQSGDLFALGAVVYRCLTGAPPSAAAPSDVLMNTLKRDGSRRCARRRRTCPPRSWPRSSRSCWSRIRRSAPRMRRTWRDLARVSAGRGWRWTLPDFLEDGGVGRGGAGLGRAGTSCAACVDTIDFAEGEELSAGARAYPAASRGCTRRADDDLGILHLLGEALLHAGRVIDDVLEGVRVHGAKRQMMVSGSAYWRKTHSRPCPSFPAR
jgi:serine/threonine-protein kinase